MKQKIVEKNKIGKNGHLYTIFDNILEYFATHLIIGIILFPFWIIFIVFKYLYIFFKWIILKLSNFIQNKNPNISDKKATTISIIIISFALIVIASITPSGNTNKNEIDTIVPTVKSTNIISENNSSSNILENENINELDEITNIVVENNITNIIENVNDTNTDLEKSISNIETNSTDDEIKPNNETINSKTTTKPIDNVQTNSEMVWIGETGNKYHRQSCRTLKKGKKQITLSQALSEGRQACKVCNP